MSFFGKFKGGSLQSGLITNGSPAKKDANAHQPTKLEKHIQDATGPPRQDGSDKFFGFENYGSTCYSNSIIQCLYYSAPFRSHVINFPPKSYLDTLEQRDAHAAPLPPRSVSNTPWPNPTSPARKQPGAGTPNPASGTKPEESKDSPEYKKRMALTSGPVLDMIRDTSNRYGMEESLFTALKDMFDAIANNQSRIGVVSPHKFLEILRRENEMFRSAMHQDAHEFLNLLLNQVVDNVELFSKQHPLINGNTNEKELDTALSHAIEGAHGTSNGLDTHWVHDLFEGLLTSETRCLTCENTSQRDEPFLDLSVDLSSHTSVTSCLRQFSEEEMLCERNKFHCDNCGGLQEAEKRMKIKRLPRVLALHLKRFKYTEDLQRLQKLFHRVVYPFYLRLFNTTDDAQDADRLYELYAVVVHIGGGPYHGHYVSIIKTQDRGWLLFDDELVEPVDKSYVMNFFGGEPVPGVQDAKQLACAYVLFYQETTLESMLKEQEMEGQPPVDSRVSESEATNLSPTKNGLFQAHTVTTPIHEDAEHAVSLTHSRTLPDLAPAARQPFEHTPSSPVIPVMPIKSKKDLKAEAKARKMAEKTEAKALEEKRRQASHKRVEAWRKQDEELKAVIEASKQSAADEAAQRGEPVPALKENQNQKEKEKEKESQGGLGRFRHGSISLRGKSKFLGGNKDGGDRLPAVPQTDEKTSGNGTSHRPSAVTANTNTSANEERKWQNRFSLGRKKSLGLI